LFKGEKLVISRQSTFRKLFFVTKEQNKSRLKNKNHLNPKEIKN